MTRHYRRRGLRLPEALAAAGLAVGAGLATFYLVRTLLARDPLEPPGRGGNQADSPFRSSADTGSGPEAA